MITHHPIFMLFPIDRTSSEMNFLIEDYYESVANLLINSSYDYILVENSRVEEIESFRKQNFQ